MMDTCFLADAPVAKIALGSLHNLVTSSLLNSPDQFPGQCDGLVCGGVGSASCEGVRDEHVGGVMPDTPQRASQANPGQLARHLPRHPNTPH